MKKVKTIFLTVSLLLVSSIFTGCIPKEKDIPIKTVYVEKECPKPRLKPSFIEYSPIILEINGEDYYAFKKSEAVKLVTNWISYREWAEANFNLIKVEDEK